MKRRMLAGLVLVMVLLVTTVSIGQAHNVPPPLKSTPSELNLPAAPAGWVVNTIDSANIVGAFASIVHNGYAPFISYYDDTNKDLRMAVPATSGGNCGPSNTWSCQVIDSTGDVGQFSSIAFPVGPGPYLKGPGIAYYDATNKALKFAERSGFPSHWTISTIAIGGFGIENGRYASVKYDSTGVVHIAYQSLNPVSTQLWHAHSVANGGNCGIGAAAGQWQCDPIDVLVGTGYYISLGISWADTPYISYYDAANQDLKMANPVTAAGNCGPGNTWSCVAVDTAGDVGQYSSIALPSTFGLFGPGIAYYDMTNGNLKFAERACLPMPCHWNISTVAAGGAGITNGMFASLQYDSNGVAHISYIATTPTLNTFLWYAHSVAGGGNCGVGGAGGYWRCDPIDGGTGVGAYSSLALSGNRPYIAYLDSGNADLKFAFLQARLYLPQVLK